MLDNKYDRFVKNKRTGKLDTRSLYKVDISSKLFKRREARQNKHYAISLVVDCSGSMLEEKIKMAAQSVQRISHHLSKIGIPHNVIAFAGHVDELKNFSAKEDKQIEDKILAELGCGSSPMNRKYDIYLLWNKGKTIPSKKKGGSMLYPFMKSISYSEYYETVTAMATAGVDIEIGSSPNWNSDAEALRFSRERLLKQTGKKIMIFLSDGQPAPVPSGWESPINPGYSQHDFNLKQEVDMTIASGIELYSIGIMDSSVQKYYPQRRTCVINDIKQLYPHIIKLIRLNLRRG